MLSLQNKNSMLGRVQWMLAGSTALICITFGLFAYRPMSNHLTSLNDRIDRQRRELADSRNETSVLGSVKADVDRLRTRLKEYKIESGQQTVGKFYAEIGSLQQQSALKNPKSQVGSVVRRDRLTEIPVQLEFDGDFTNVYSFLRQTEDLPRLTRVPKMRMTSLKDKNGQVKVWMTLNLYIAAAD